MPVVWGSSYSSTRILAHGGRIRSDDQHRHDHDLDAVGVLPLPASLSFVHHFPVHRGLCHDQFSFLIANLDKFIHGGYVSMIINLAMIYVMWAWYQARKIRNRFVEFVKLKDYLPLLR